MSASPDSPLFAGGTPHRASHEGGRRFIDAEGACVSSSVPSSATGRLPVSSSNSSLPRHTSLTRSTAAGNENLPNHHTVEDNGSVTNRLSATPSGGVVILNMLASQSRTKGSSNSLASSWQSSRNGTQSASSPIPFSASMTSSSVSASRGPLASLKVVVIGDYAVGKTSLIRQLTQRRFSHTTGTTIGVEFKEHTTPNAILQLWDVAGQQYSSSMTKQYYRGSAGAIVCADVTKETSFLAALDWRKDLMEKVGTEEVECLIPIDDADERISKLRSSRVNPRGSDGRPHVHSGENDDTAAGRSSDLFEERHSSRGNLCESVSERVPMDHFTESPRNSNGNLPDTDNNSNNRIADDEFQQGNHTPPQASVRYEVKKITRCAIPVFLFVNKGDLLSQSTFDVEKIKAFAEENHFDTAVITSAKDHASVRDAFQYVTNLLLEHHEANLTSTFLIQSNASTTSYPSPLGQNATDSVNRRSHVNRVVRLGRYQNDTAINPGNENGMGGNPAKTPSRLRGGNNSSNNSNGEDNNDRGKCC